MAKTVFIIADSALELIPKKIVHLEVIKKTAKKRGKLPHSMILDSSYHHTAMTKLKDSNKRGRPDILHVCLLNLLGTPLVRETPDEIRILLHTFNGKVIEINPDTRLPKHYPRFIGLMEQLLIKGLIESKEKTLMKILPDTTIAQEIINIPSTQRLLFTFNGKSINAEEYFKEISSLDIGIIIGGFPHGTFSKEVDDLSSTKISISKYHLEAWTVIARAVYVRERSQVYNKSV
ncbi:MAG: 16S rRNA methyltransferase [Candidatus Heimdallarchaeota archaeon]